VGIEIIRIESTTDIPAIAHKRMAGVPELVCALFKRGALIREFCMQRLVQIHLGADTHIARQRTIWEKVEIEHAPHVLLDLWKKERHSDRKAMQEAQVQGEDRLTMSIISLNWAIMSFAPASHSSIVDLDQRSAPFSYSSA
jgi:hypothetical protein